MSFEQNSKMEKGNNNQELLLQPQSRKNPPSVTSSRCSKDSWGKVCGSGISKYGEYNLLNVIKVLKCPLERPRIATRLMSQTSTCSCCIFSPWLPTLSSPAPDSRRKSGPYLCKQANLIKVKMKKIPKISRETWRCNLMFRWLLAQHKILYAMGICVIFNGNCY